MTTGQDAVFEVELSHTGVTTGEWWLGDNLLQNNDLNQMSSEGRVHRLVLKMVTTDESGDVAFVVGEEKSVACLLVEEKPKGKKNYVMEYFTPHMHLYLQFGKLKSDQILYVLYLKKNAIKMLTQILQLN